MDDTRTTPRRGGLAAALVAAALVAAPAAGCSADKSPAAGRATTTTERPAARAQDRDDAAGRPTTTAPAAEDRAADEAPGRGGAAGGTDACRRWAEQVDRAVAGIDTDNPDPDQTLAALEAARRDAPAEVADDLDVLVRWARDVLPGVEKLQAAVAGGQPLDPAQMEELTRTMQGGGTEELQRASDAVQQYLAENCGGAPGTAG